MTLKVTTLWIAGSVLVLAGSGCAADAHAAPNGAALQSAGAGAGDYDDDIDEDTDEGVDEDNDVDEGPNDDFELTVDELPAAVRTVVDAQVGAGTITGIDRDKGPAGLEYEIEYTLDGAQWEIDVGEDGTVLRTERD